MGGTVGELVGYLDAGFYDLHLACVITVDLEVGE